MAFILASRGLSGRTYTCIPAGGVQRLPYLGLAVLLKDGNLLHKAVWREDCVQRLHIYRVHGILNLRNNLNVSLSDDQGSCGAPAVRFPSSFERV